MDSKWLTRPHTHGEGRSTAFASTYNSLSPPVHLPRPARYATYNYDRQQRRDFSRTYHPGMARTRPNSVPNGVVALDNFNQPFTPWRIPDSWKPPPSKPRAKTGELRDWLSRPVQASYNSFKFNKISAGREGLTPREVVAVSSEHHVDKEESYYPAGLGYGKLHRHHYVYKGRDMEPRISNETQIRPKYIDILDHLHREENELL